MTPAISALILAGGQSSRMGRDKALIPIQGVPLIRRVYEAALPSCDAVYVISSWGDRYRSVLPESCKFIPEMVAGHTTGTLPYTHGPLIAFSQGLSYLQERSKNREKSDWILLLACDLPNLQSAMIQGWCDRIDDCPDSTIALLPSYGTKGWHPLCGFYHDRCFPSLQRFIGEGGRSFQKWLGQEEVRSLPVDDPELLFNCNTPSDLKQLIVKPYGAL